MTIKSTCWDENWQRAYFDMHFDPAQNQVVVLNGQDIGVISAERREDDIRLSAIYILPKYQGRGIGTQLLNDLLAQAFRQDLPVSLRVLKVNPARRLYERLGFVVVDEADTHYIMKMTPP